MKRLLIILTTAVMFFLVTCLHVGAEMMDTLLPQDTEQKTEGKVELEYNEYKLSSYIMDTKLEDSEASDMMPWGWDDGIQKQMDQSLSVLNSTIWGLNKVFGNIVGVLVSESYNYDVISNFSNEIGKTIQSIAGFGPGGFSNNGIWPYLVTLMVCIMAIWAAYVGIVERATSKAMGGILKSIAVLVLSLAFFTSADTFLNAINKSVSEVQNDILSFSISAATPEILNENEGIATMRNQIFNLMIKYPWLLLEFGTTDEEAIESEWDKSGSRIGAILSNSPLSGERLDAVTYEVEDLNNTSMTPRAQTDRFMILILTIVMNVIMGVILLMLSGSLILYQILVLVFAIFSPLALLFGLIPAFSNTAKNVMMKLAHAFYMKIAIAFLMTIYFSISSMVYNAMDPEEGYILLFSIQIICTVAVWIKRNEIMNIITVPFRKSTMSSNIGQNLKEYKQTYLKGQKYFNTIKKPFVTTAKPLAERASYKLKYKPGVGAADPIRHSMFHSSRRNENPAEATIASIPAKNKPKVKPNIADQSVVSRKPTQQINPEPAAPKYQSPKLRNIAHFDSLKGTLEKGGKAHRNKEEKEPIQLKTRETVKSKAFKNVR